MIKLKLFQLKILERAVES